MVGHEADQVAAILPRDVAIVENEYFSMSGPARSLRMALRITEAQRALVVHGDLVFNGAAVSGRPDLGSHLVVDRNGGIAPGNPGITLEKERVHHVDYDLPMPWAQIAFLQGDALELVRKVVGASRNYKMLLHEVMNAVARKVVLRVHGPKKLCVAEIDCVADYERAMERFRGEGFDE